MQRWLMAMLVAAAPASTLVEPANAQAFKAACRVEELCKGVESGGGRIINCLREHKSELSEECFAAIGHSMINSRPKGAGAGHEPHSASGTETPQQ